MDPPIQRKILRDGTLPGVPVPEGKRIQNSSLHLTYKTHIPKQEYREWFGREVMPKHCAKGRLFFLGIAHEGEDMIDSYDHTHVVVLTELAAIDISNWRVLDWAKTSLRPRDARVRILKGDRAIKDALYYLGDEDKEYALNHGIYPIPKRSISKQPVGICVSIPNTNIAPIYRVEHMRRWQVDVMTMMNDDMRAASIASHIDPDIDCSDNEQEPLPQAIHNMSYRGLTIKIVCDFQGEAGKKTLLKALKYEDPNEFLIINGVPNALGLSKLIESAKSSEWTEGTLIINTRYQETPYNLDEVIGHWIGITESIACHGLWIFTNVVPKFNRLDTRHMKFYKISGDWDITRIVSSLHPMTHKEADIERQRQEKVFNTYSIIPRKQL